MKRLGIALLFILMATSVTYAESISLEFNDDSAQLGYAHVINQDYYGTSLLNFRGLYNQDKETKLGTIGFEFSGEPGNAPGLRFGIGGDVYGGTTDVNQDMLALGVIGKIAYAPPTLGGLGFEGKIGYAPKIFSLLDLDRLLETNVGVSFAIMPNVKVYVDYQNIKADFEYQRTTHIDENVRVGFTAKF